MPPADGYSSLILLAYPGFRSGSEKVRSGMQRVNPEPVGMNKPGAQLHLNTAGCLRDRSSFLEKLEF